MITADFKTDKEVIQGKTDPCKRPLPSLYGKA